jgi:hypothetical protein
MRERNARIVTPPRPKALVPTTAWKERVGNRVPAVTVNYKAVTLYETQTAGCGCASLPQSRCKARRPGDDSGTDACLTIVAARITTFCVPYPLYQMKMNQV